MFRKFLLKNKTFWIALFSCVAAVVLYIYSRYRNKLLKEHNATTYGLKGDAEITAEQASYYAEKLFFAMSRFGTDEDTIKEVLIELRNHKKAILQVHEAFGLCRYALGASDVLGVKLNLNQWLKRELSRKEFAEWDILYKDALSE